MSPHNFRVTSSFFNNKTAQLGIKRSGFAAHQSLHLVPNVNIRATTPPAKPSRWHDIEHVCYHALHNLMSFCPLCTNTQTESYQIFGLSAWLRSCKTQTLRAIFGFKRQEVKGKWIKSHTGGLHTSFLCAVTTRTRLRVGRYGVLNPAEEEINLLSKTSRLVLGCTQPPVQWVWRFFPRSKAAVASDCPITSTYCRG
jgi:hypothetical protein